MAIKLEVRELVNYGDARGPNFTIPVDALAFVGRLADVYLACTKPNSIRGNHYHLRRREALVVLPGSPWSLHWDEDENVAAQHRDFDGKHAVLILISPGASHAMRNDGDSDLWFFAVSSENYDPAESVTRKVV